MTKRIRCDYCGGDAHLTTSRKVYGGRDYGPIYYCAPCRAWVGVHKGTTNPLGRVANAELREWKKRAHAAFDPLWKAKIAREGCSKSHARNSGYAWLASHLGISVKDCHIGMFDVDLCQRTVMLCEKYSPHGYQGR